MSNIKNNDITLGKETHKKVTALLSSRSDGVAKRSSAAAPETSDLQVRDDGNVDDRDNPLPSRERFMTGFQETVTKSLGNAYAANHPLHLSPLSGVVSSSLCEDVFALVNIQREVLHDYVTESQLLGTDVGDTVLINCLSFVIRTLGEFHVLHRDTFATSFERSCATANDFYRMMESAEEFWAILQCTYPKLLGKSSGHASVLHEEVSSLLSLYSSDAVYVARRAHTFFIEDIQQSQIPNQLFSVEWEDVYTSNEVAMSITATLEDYLGSFRDFLCNDLLYRKVVDALIRAVACFYVNQLVHKADEANRHRNHMKCDKMMFSNPTRAVGRMNGDLELFRTLFRQLAEESPSLGPVVRDEMSALVLIHECLGLAVTSNSSTTDLKELVIVVHTKLTRNTEVTRLFLGDLWLLAASPSQRNDIYKAINVAQTELVKLSLHMEETAASIPKNDRDPLKGVTLSETLQDLYEKRKNGFHSKHLDPKSVPSMSSVGASISKHARKATKVVTEASESLEQHLDPKSLPSMSSLGTSLTKHARKATKAAVKASESLDRALQEHKHTKQK